MRTLLYLGKILGLSGCLMALLVGGTLVTTAWQLSPRAPLKAALALLAAPAIFAYVAWWLWPLATAQRIATEGIPRQGTIRNVRETGIMLGNALFVDLELELSCDDGSPQNLSFRDVVPLALVGKLKCGELVDLTVDRERSGRVTVWTRPEKRC
jgi:hypothetical protein